MKKRRLLIAGILILTGFFLYAILVTSIRQKTVSIPYSMNMVQDQLSDIRNVAKWWAPFSGMDSNAIRFSYSGNDKLNAGDHSITIEKSNSLNTWYTVLEKENKQLFEFSILPDTGGHCQLVLQYETTLWKRIIGNDPLLKEAMKSLDDMNDYLRDKKKLYGFEIEETLVTDTTFLFKSITVSNAEKKEGMGRLFTDLMNYAKEKNAGYNGIRIFYSSQISKDSITLFASIGISNSQVSTHENGPVFFKRMPYKKNLLVAYYQGKFGELDKAYKALQLFKKDFGLNSMAIPFTKFLTDGYAFDDNQVIQAVVCYPVF